MRWKEKKLIFGTFDKYEIRLVKIPNGEIKYTRRFSIKNPNTLPRDYNKKLKHFKMLSENSI